MPLNDQIDEPTAGKKVTVEERIDGRMVGVCQVKTLRYWQITERPERKKRRVVKKTR